MHVFVTALYCENQPNGIRGECWTSGQLTYRTALALTFTPKVHLRVTNASVHRKYTDHIISSLGKQCELSGCQDCQSGARRNHFTYSGVSVAKYLARRNKNSCCTSQRYSDIGSLFATILLISLGKECVPCSSARSVRLLQRDGLFKATQVVHNEK